MKLFEQAAVYHAHHSRHNEDLGFWLSIAAEAGSPVVELGCGTGRVLLPLLAAGICAVGIDRDRAALRFLKQAWLQAQADRGARPDIEGIGKPEEYQQDNPECQPQVFQADFTCFGLARQFTLALLPCNTYSTLTAIERGLLLEQVRVHLSPGGQFAAAIPNPALLDALPARSAFQNEEYFPHPWDGEPVIVSSGWRRGHGEFAITWRYDHLLADGTVDRWETVVRHHLTSARTILSELEQAGFRAIEVWGDYDGSNLSDDSPQMIFMATKRRCVTGHYPAHHSPTRLCTVFNIEAKHRSGQSL